MGCVVIPRVQGGSLSLGCKAFQQETVGIINLHQNSIYPCCFHWWVLPLGLLPTAGAVWSLGRIQDPFCQVFFARCFLKALFRRLFCKVTFGRPFLEDPFCRVLLQGSFWKTFSARPHQPQNAWSQLRPKVSSISCFSGSPRGHWVSMTLRGPALSDASASLEAPGSPWLPPPEPICFHRASRFGLGDYFAFSFPCTL